MATYKYSIQQINEELPNIVLKMFVDYDTLIERYGKIDFNDYDTVYTGEIISDNEYEALEELFEMFNIGQHPMDFHGHSLSVSDVVELDGSVYYCDSCGWTKIE